MRHAVIRAFKLTNGREWSTLVRNKVFAFYGTRKIIIGPIFRYKKRNKFLVAMKNTINLARFSRRFS